MKKFFLLLYYIFKDMRLRDDSFREYGLTLFVGRQGAGKTIAMVDYLEQMRELYPEVIIVTNFGYQNQNYEFNDLNQFLTIRNGTDGVIFAIDEIQNEFSSDNWKSMPPGFLQEITQQRKQRIKVVGTSQVFTRVTKALREQTNEVVVCKTFANRYTSTSYYDAQDYNNIIDTVDGTSKITRLKKHSFVQTDDIRALYDTYQKIEKMSRVGLVPKEG